MGPAVANGPELRVDPALAEASVVHALAGATGSGIAPAWVRAHRQRLDGIYERTAQAERDAAFGQLALAEFVALGLGVPILEAQSERPGLASARMILLGEAGGRLEEGVTCEPGGAHLGIRIAAGRFEDRGALLAWARHAFGHAEDTLDPAFEFEPGWEEAVRGRQRLVVGRLHELWDVTVDARLAAAGRVDTKSALRRHRAAVAGHIPDVAASVADRVVAHLWSRPRPAFPQLRSWAERPADLAREAAPGDVIRPRSERCPLCGFPSDDVGAPEGDVAAAAEVDYPGWDPADGICGRCADRYRFARALGGRA